jgi:gamma-D-glutamyl-L-lysine dipeptidyl-peptidase
LIESIYRIIEDVRMEFAPDPRVSVFEVDVARDEAGWVLFGAVSAPAAAEALSARTGVLDIGIRNALLRLPFVHDGDPPHALVVASVAPMLAGPIISESQVSQALLGHRLLVLRDHGRWLQCRSIDGYLGWVHRGYLRRVDEQQARSWEVGGDAPVHFCLGAEVTDPCGAVVARLPWGSRIHVRDEIALLPDGSQGLLRGATVPLSELPGRFALDGAAIVETALRWCGAAYVWGGTNPWGVDCSGLVQAVYRTHGFEMPRDSDHQAREGEAVEPGEDFEAVLPGDLHFFAEQRDRISHVAISMGGSRIVHSALGNGGVQSNDLLGDLAYERELRSLRVRTRRILSRES